MRLSVIVPFLDEEKYIRRLLETLVNQDFDKKEYEIIFVDNGSTDGSRAIVSQFGGVVLLREEGGGAYKARNAGLKAAKGEIIACTDADCVVSKDWLAAIYKGIRDLGASVVLGQINFPQNSSAALRIFEDYNNAKLEYTLKYCEPKYYYGNAGNIAFKADVVRKVGPFSEKMTRIIDGDAEMVQRCLAEYEGCKIAYLEDMKIEHQEVATVSAWLKKIYIYGRWHVPGKQEYGYAPLPLKQRFAVFDYCCRNNKYGPWKKMAALFFLALGTLFIESGRLARKLKGGRG
jgi:glycosyltransferase involved in cell wall biosynthesis